MRLQHCGLIVDDLELLDRGLQVRPARDLGVAELLIGELEIGGGQRVAVVELHPGSELELPGGVIGELPLGR